MSEEAVITGTVEDIIFQNKENGYTVFSIDTEEEEVTCVGIVPQIHTGESLKMIGSWVVHQTYGRQFQVSLFEKAVPTTKEGMEKYLSSRIIKGLGPKMAKKIVERFGEATFYVIEEKPDRLAEIKGISYEKAMMISSVFQEQHQLRSAVVFLQGLGISTAYAMKIYKKYKERTYDIVKQNPYRLADDIFGIGFKMSDKLAAAMGITPDSPHRVKSGIKYILNQEAGNGHVYLPKGLLIEKAEELLGIHPAVIENSIMELQVDNQIWQERLSGEDIVYLNTYYSAEMAVAKKLLELAEAYEVSNKANIDGEIEAFEKSSGIFLAERQKEAVREAMSNGLLVITGGPGTGKTTTINTIIGILKEEETEIVLAAPTGRAAKRMTEATGMEAQTIHRLLGINFINDDSRRQTFDKNEDDPIEADVIIIDESSMVDILLMNSLLRAISHGTRLILVGDVDQLPSVGPGNVLKDIIRSERIKVVKLNEIFRQAQESAIIMNAHRINQGLEPVLNEKERDFFFLRRASVEDVVSAIVQLVTKRLPNFVPCDPVSDIQILTPMRKSPVGVQNLNMVLQRTLNPPMKEKKEKEYRSTVFRQGDKVMQIKNNYNTAWRIYNEFGRRVEEGTGVFNGDEGVILDIDEINETITVLFDDNKRVDYDFTQLDELELAYAITIHKSQGSEYPVVIIPIHSGPYMLMSRNLLYTAVTRAKQLVVIVGLQETMKKMIDNNREINRYSSLSCRIEALYDFFHQKEG